MQKITKPLTVNEAYARYSSLCARQECCRHDLVEKMYRKGMPDEAIASVLQQLAEEGFIDEERFCRAFVHDKFYFSVWGKIRLRAELRKREIPNDIIARCLQEIDEAEYADTLRELLRGYARQVVGKSAYERQCKMVRYALQRGFEQSLAMGIAESLVNESV